VLGVTRRRYCENQSLATPEIGLDFDLSLFREALMALELFRIDGKTAWVTGGTKGLGLTMADALAEAGAQVIITSRHEDEAEARAAEIARKHGRRAFGMAADVVDAAEVAAVVSRAERELGGVDILVNNAGINVRKATADLSVDEWRQVIDVNLTGPFVCTKAVMPGLVAKRWGRVINMSSMLGLVGLAGRPPYTASKGGLVLLTRTQALEVASQGVTVNAICPGPFATDMNRQLLDDPKKYQDFVAKIPMGRWGELHELAGVVVFLASHASSYVTGSVLTVDGGWTAQ
jgi:NAD(P)-dependent dehydrogenase (short-subunit alcohol dehydrogenase family)